MKLGVSALVLAAVLLAALSVPQAVDAAVTISRAELSGGNMRVEGQGARANATILVDGLAMGKSDGAGAFRIEASYASPSCRITVSDGSTSAQATLSGCTPTGPGKPSFWLRTDSGTVGSPLKYQAQGTAAPASSLAFVFDWGDGTTLRDPATGFYTTNSTGWTAGAIVSHAWATAGTFTVTVKAIDSAGRSVVSDPITVTVVPPAVQNDCASGGDVSNALAGALSLTPPATCTGSLDYNGADMTDVYQFTVSQPFRLLTLRVSPVSMWNATDPEITLIDPAGNRHSTLTDLGCHGFDCPLIGLPKACSPLEAACTYLVDYTMPVTGTWKLVLGGDVSTIGRSTFVTGSYAFSIQMGGGGDDCVQGRSSALGAPAPLDAPNHGYSLRLLGAGEANCTGSMPYRDLDFADGYVFPVLQGEPVVVSAVSTEGLAACTGIRGQLLGPVGKVSGQTKLCVESLLLNPSASGDVSFDLTASWTAPTDTRAYRLRVATGSRHNGDCFTGADAANAFATATTMSVAACVGDISAADPNDWYAVPVTAGQAVWASAVPCGCALSALGPVQPILPMELYDPDGLLRQRNLAGNFFVADKTGAWRIKVTTDSLNLPHFEGPYGFQPQFGQISMGLIAPSIVGGQSGTGSVYFSPAPPTWTNVLLTSSNPAVASVPSVVGVPAGSASGSLFTITTAPVTSPTTVTITASAAGLTRSVTLTVTPPVAADSVSIQLAQYDSGKRVLQVEATSSKPQAILYVYRTDGMVAIGQLTGDGSGRYRGQFSLGTNPQNITVKSSLGGSASKAVTAK